MPKILKAGGAKSAKVSNKSTQSYKYTLSTSGEFLVAGELWRRGIHASVTYGNAKQLDVIAIGESKIAKIEVKTTQKTKWVLGSKIPKDDEKIWVLVHLPETLSESPSYWVLNGKELHGILMPAHAALRNKRFERDGKEPPDGVVSIQRTQLPDNSFGAWLKLETLVR